MKRTQTYWNNRFLDMNNRVLMDSMKYHEYVERIFKKAEREIQADISMWYARLAINNNVSYQNAIKLLKQDELKEFHWTVEEYIKHGKENRITKDWHKELENASAKYHITRLESLLFQMKEHVNNLYAGYYEGLFDTLSNTYEQAYYRTAYEIENVTGAKSSFSRLDKDTINKVLETPWASDGRDFSDRLWSDKNKLINNLRTELTIGLIRGDRQEKIVRSFAERMHASLTNAGRLIATESAYFASVGSLDSLKELGVEEYEYLATLDTRTSPMCREMDGKVFKIEDFKPGITAPPLHCWCRSTTVPKIDDEKGVERTARDENNKSVTVPNTTYETWYKERVAKKQTTQVKNDKIKEKKLPISDWENMKTFNSYEVKESLLYFKEETVKWRKQLSEDEVKAVNSYTGDDYLFINGYLRKNREMGNEAIESVKKQIKLIDDALSKFEVKDYVRLYRGCPRKDKITKDMIGNIIQDPAYQSATTLYNQAAEFAEPNNYGEKEHIFEICMPPGKGRGAYVCSVSEIQSESEFLIARGTRFKIIDVNESYGIVNVRLEVAENE